MIQKRLSYSVSFMFYILTNIRMRTKSTGLKLRNLGKFMLLAPGRPQNILNYTLSY